MFRIETVLGEGARRPPRHVRQLAANTPTRGYKAQNLGVLRQTLRSPAHSFSLGQLGARVGEWPHKLSKPVPPAAHRLT